MGKIKFADLGLKKNEPEIKTSETTHDEMSDEQYEQVLKEAEEEIKPKGGVEIQKPTLSKTSGSAGEDETKNKKNSSTKKASKKKTTEKKVEAPAVSSDRASENVSTLEDKLESLNKMVQGLLVPNSKLFSRDNLVHPDFRKAFSDFLYTLPVPDEGKKEQNRGWLNQQKHYRRPARWTPVLDYLFKFLDEIDRGSIDGVVIHNGIITIEKKV